MLRGNLSTRPFYNDRLVTVAIVAAAVIVCAATALNLTGIYSLVTERFALLARIDAETREAARIRSQATALQGSVDRPTLARLAASAREANQLIDLRTFSWTRLFGHLEDTLPPGVRLTSVAPRPERGQFQVALAVVARGLDDIDEFVEALYATAGFYDVAPLEQRALDDGSFQALIQASYLAPPQTASEPAAGGGERTAAP